MAGRSHTTFQKRQKELARQQKHREKLERRLQRKHEKQAAQQQPVGDDLEPGLPANSESETSHE